eukprot:14899536-Alexandrium_andersonii.AAC.1
MFKGLWSRSEASWRERERGSRQGASRDAPRMLGGLRCPRRQARGFNRRGKQRSPWARGA